MSRTRQQKQSEEVLEKILRAARHILEEEGPDALSIRRITREIDYSAAIVYHYFRDKDDLLHHLLMEAYGRILEAIRHPQEGMPPAEALRASFRGYVDGALRWPREYRAVMLSAKPGVLAVTSVLDADVREKRPAFRQLIATIEAGVADGSFAPCDPILTAQAVWCTMFGLVTRLILEDRAEDSRCSALIDRQIDLILKGLTP